MAFTKINNKTANKTKPKIMKDQKQRLSDSLFKVPATSIPASVLAHLEEERQKFVAMLNDKQAILARLRTHPDCMTNEDGSQIENEDELLCNSFHAHLQEDGVSYFNQDEGHRLREIIDADDSMCRHFRGISIVHDFLAFTGAAIRDEVVEEPAWLREFHLNNPPFAALAT